MQDLHGYDNPWPAGGGKNLAILEQGTINLTSGEEEISDTRVRTNFIPVQNGVTYVASSQNDGWNVRNGILYDSEKNRLSAGVYPSSVQHILTIDNSNAAYIRIVYSHTNTSETCSPSDYWYQFEEGSIATSYAPYSNICPITGWAGAKVMRCGKNLFDQSDTLYLGQDVSAYGASDNKALAQINNLPAGTYTLSFAEKIISLNGIEPIATKFGLYLRAISNGNTFNVNAQTNLITPLVGEIITKTVVFTLTDEFAGKFQYFYVYTGKNDQVPGPNMFTANIYDIQLEPGSTATDYEPYQGETYDITFPTEAGTVYGGTLDVTNGVLTVDRAYEQMTYSYLSGLNQNYIGWTNNITIVGGNAVWVRNWNYSNAAPRTAGGIKANCNAFPISMHNTDIFSSQYRIYFGVGGMSTVAEFLNTVQMLEANGSGIFIVYELATPVTYQLAPAEITTLLGVNNVWADTGDIKKLTYLTKK